MSGEKENAFIVLHTMYIVFIIGKLKNILLMEIFMI